jgi:predicted transcriptional regulator
MQPRKTELTDHELEIMKVIWERGSATVRRNSRSARRWCLLRFR